MGWCICAGKTGRHRHKRQCRPARAQCSSKAGTSFALWCRSCHFSKVPLKAFGRRTQRGEPPSPTLMQRFFIGLHFHPPPQELGDDRSLQELAAASRQTAVTKPTNRASSRRLRRNTAVVCRTPHVSGATRLLRGAFVDTDLFFARIDCRLLHCCRLVFELSPNLGDG